MYVLEVNERRLPQPKAALRDLYLTVYPQKEEERRLYGACKVEWKWRFSRYYRVMIKYTWYFPALDCIPSESGLVDVVQTIHWCIRGDEQTASGSFTSEIFGATVLDPVNPNEFIPFDQITTGMAADWVMSKTNITGTTGVYECIANDIAYQQNPPIVQKQIGS